MKKVISLITLICFCFLAVACGKRYTVTVVLDGTTYQTITVNSGETLEDHDFGIDEVAYLLDGWYLNNSLFDLKTPISSDITLTGSTTDREYKIVFKNDNGAVLRTRTYYAYEEIEKPSNPVKVRDAQYEYTFAGWNQEFDYAKKDMEIFATYTKTLRKYKVSVLNEDGSTKEELDLEYGSKLNLTNPVKATNDYYAYNFEYWRDSEGNKIDMNQGITGNITVSPFFSRTPQKHDTTNMTVSIVGDSISTFYKAGDSMISMYSGNDEFYYPKYGNWIKSGSETWWGQLINKLNAKLGINNSLSGSCCYNWGSETQAQAGCNDIRLDYLDDNGSPDIIITFLGANDNVNGFTDEQFRYAYNRMLTKINQKYPNAYVFCMTMGYSAYSSYNYTEERRISYNNIIRECAQKNNATIIDYALVHTQENYKSLFGDALHFSKAGMDLCANTCYEVISDYFKK